MDTSTGVLLLLVPSLSLTLMNLGETTAPIAYLRFIGAFVFAVGTLYFAAWRLADLGRLVEWRILWLATAWARLCVGTTVSILIASGALEVGWVSVPVADLGLGVYQMVTGLRKGVNEESE